MALYDVYFRTTKPMVISVEADDEEEAERIVEEDDGTLLDTEELLNRFASSLEFNEYLSIDYVEKVD